MKSLSAVALSATTTGRLSVAADPYIVHHHTHLPAGLSVTFCAGKWQVLVLTAVGITRHQLPEQR